MEVEAPAIGDKSSETYDSIVGELSGSPPIGEGFGGTSMVMGDNPLSKHEAELWGEWNEGGGEPEDPRPLSLYEIERQKFLREASQGEDMEMGMDMDIDSESKMESLGDDPTLLPDSFPIPDNSYEVGIDTTSSPSYPPKKPTPKRDKKVKSELWTPEEDKLLMEKVTETGGQKWNWIVSQMGGKNLSQCRTRYNVLKRKKMGGWTDEENKLLRQLHYNAKERLIAGELKKGRFWSWIASQMEGRDNKQVRERWDNVIDPTINHEPFTLEEDQIIINHVQQTEGNPSWVFLEGELSNEYRRPQNKIKNRWTTLKKRMEKDAE